MLLVCPKFEKTATELAKNEVVHGRLFNNSKQQQTRFNVSRELVLASWCHA
jgi:hypothetical protein